MNTNKDRMNKIVSNLETKNVKKTKTKTKIKFKNNTLISGLLYKKDQEYEVDNIELFKNFIY